MTLKSDVRIIAATNKNLEKEIKEGRFREDLYYRLNVINIKLPSLRERVDDISILSDHFLIKYTKRNKKNIKGFSPQTVEVLKNYSWPGNVRELENIIERAVIVSKSELIGPNDLPDNINQGTKTMKGMPLSIPSGMTMKEAEKKIVLKALQEANNNKTKAAKILGISLRKIDYKLKEWSNNVSKKTLKPAIKV